MLFLRRSQKNINITFFNQLERYICSSLLFIILTTIPFLAHAKSAWTPTFDLCAPESEIIGTVMYAIDDEKSFSFINTSLSRKEMSTWLYWALKAEKYEIATKFLNFNADPNAMVYCHTENKAKAQPMLETIPLIKVEMLHFLAERGLDVTPNIFEELFYSQGIPSKNPSQMRVVQARQKIKDLYLLVKSKTPNYKKPGLGKLLNLPDTGINEKAVASFISWLIKEGIADGNKYTPGGTYTGWPNTALSYAIIKKRELITQALMESDINITGIDGPFTPLMYAIGKRSEETITLLLEKGKGMYTQEQLDSALETCSLRTETYYLQHLLTQAGAKARPRDQCYDIFCATNWLDNKTHAFLYKNSSIKVHIQPTNSTDIKTWTVQTNQKVDVVATMVGSQKVIVRKAKESFTLECGEVLQGDIIETLQPAWGESNIFFIRHKNRICKSNLSFYPQTILIGEDGLKFQWWIGIMNPDTNELGWVKVSRQNLIFVRD